MNAFLEAVAAQLRCVNIEAVSGYSSITVMSYRFQCRETDSNWMLLGTRFRRDNNFQYNVNRATLLLVERLPALAAQAEAERESRLKYRQAKELSKRTGWNVSYDGQKFTFSYSSATVEGVEQAIVAIDKLLEDAWQELLKSPKGTEVVHFTCEGGFSLN